MFTGIIEEVGKVKQIFSNSIVISAKKVLSDVKLGDSIAVNGVCLTVVKYSEAEFEVDVMPETFRCSNLGKLKSGSEVNLERAMSANGRFGGHIVSGHIDCCGIINNMTKEDNAVIVEQWLDTTFNQNGEVRFLVNIKTDRDVHKMMYTCHKIVLMVVIA